MMTRTDRGAAGRLDRLTHAAVWRAVRRIGRAAGLAMPRGPTASGMRRRRGSWT